MTDLSHLDDLIRQRKHPHSLCIGIAGGSGAGKSTVCEQIRQGLSPGAVAVIALDRFFKPTEQLPPYYSAYHQGYQPDYNTPSSLRIDDMAAHCRQSLNAGVLLLDGHFALYYPELRALMDIRCFVSAGLEEMLARRTARNLAAGYGGDRDNILAYNRECVAPRYEQFIAPTQRFADVVIPNHQADAPERDALIQVLCQKIRAHAALAGA